MRNAAKYTNEKVDLQGIQIRIFKPVVVAFAWEEAVDGACPIREFFQLLIREIRESSIFQGSWFSHDLGLLASRHWLESLEHPSWRKCPPLSIICWLRSATI